ncbi:MAG: hypothetical protein J7K68_01185 [Candidatus Diapherotrites archaeon]|nr:hypothetical protein [Candidatus Diapherotrites archaeon]
MVIVVEMISIGKRTVLNINAIAAIVIFSLAVIVALWQLLPSFAPEPATLPAGELDVEFEYFNQVYQGENWTVNVTLSNNGLRTIKNITVMIATDGYVEGNELNVDALLPLKTRQYQIDCRIRDNAKVGEHSVAAVTTASDATASTKMLNITILEKPNETNETG